MRELFRVELCDTEAFRDVIVSEYVEALTFDEAERIAYARCVLRGMVNPDVRVIERGTFVRAK